MFPSLSEVESLARQAGDILRTGYGQNHHVTYKGEIDLVTEVDRQSEAFLMGEIRRRYPHHAVVAEESGGLVGEACCKWYIDPLDGTVNFAHGIPIFSISLAYVQKGEIQLGVVYDPLRDECFSAEASKGAWLNGKQIRISDAEDLEQSLLVTGFPYDIRTHPQTNLDVFTKFSLKSQGVRRLGSAALDLCYVAAGRFDGYWELRLSPWDLAAGALIAREAGALVSDLQGGQNYLQPPYSILAATPSVYAQMMGVLHSS
ncbi:MAG TPA: inositol monophosphatase family protein [Anaerolineales bacterium]|nr:inositol monophosphatase family protein [Anaerolineales bacterium]